MDVASYKSWDSRMGTCQTYASACAAGQVDRRSNLSVTSNDSETGATGNSTSSATNAALITSNGGDADSLISSDSTPPPDSTNRANQHRAVALGMIDTNNPNSAVAPSSLTPPTSLSTASGGHRGRISHPSSLLPCSTAQSPGQPSTATFHSAALSSLKTSDTAPNMADTIDQPSASFAHDNVVVQQPSLSVPKQAMHKDSLSCDTSSDCTSTTQEATQIPGCHRPSGDSSTLPSSPSSSSCSNNKIEQATKQPSVAPLLTANSGTQHSRSLPSSCSSNGGLKKKSPLLPTAASLEQPLPAPLAFPSSFLLSTLWTSTSPSSHKVRAEQLLSLANTQATDDAPSLCGSSCSEISVHYSGHHPIVSTNKPDLLVPPQQLECTGEDAQSLLTETTTSCMEDSAAATAAGSNISEVSSHPVCFAHPEALDQVNSLPSTHTSCSIPLTQQPPPGEPCQTLDALQLPTETPYAERVDTNSSGVAGDTDSLVCSSVSSAAVLESARTQPSVLLADMAQDTMAAAVGTVGATDRSSISSSTESHSSPTVEHVPPVSTRHVDDTEQFPVRIRRSNVAPTAVTHDTDSIPDSSSLQSECSVVLAHSAAVANPADTVPGEDMVLVKEYPVRRSSVESHSLPTTDSSGTDQQTAPALRSRDDQDDPAVSTDGASEGSSDVKPFKKIKTGLWPFSVTNAYGDSSTLPESDDSLSVGQETETINPPAEAQVPICKPVQYTDVPLEYDERSLQSDTTSIDAGCVFVQRKPQVEDSAKSLPENRQCAVEHMATSDTATWETDTTGSVHDTQLQAPRSDSHRSNVDGTSTSSSDRPAIVHTYKCVPARNATESSLSQDSGIKTAGSDCAHTPSTEGHQRSPQGVTAVAPVRQWNVDNPYTRHADDEWTLSSGTTEADTPYIVCEQSTVQPVHLPVGVGLSMAVGFTDIKTGDEGKARLYYKHGSDSDVLSCSDGSTGEMENVWQLCKNVAADQLTTSTQSSTHVISPLQQGCGSLSKSDGSSTRMPENSAKVVLGQDMPGLAYDSQTLSSSSSEPQAQAEYFRLVSAAVRCVDDGSLTSAHKSASSMEGYPCKVPYLQTVLGSKQEHLHQGHDTDTLSNGSDSVECPPLHHSDAKGPVPPNLMATSSWTSQYDSPHNKGCSMVSSSSCSTMQNVQHAIARRQWLDTASDTLTVDSTVTPIHSSYSLAISDDRERTTQASTTSTSSGRGKTQEKHRGPCNPTTPKYSLSRSNMTPADWSIPSSSDDVVEQCSVVHFPAANPPVLGPYPKNVESVFTTGTIKACPSAEQECSFTDDSDSSEDVCPMNKEAALLIRATTPTSDYWSVFPSTRSVKEILDEKPQAQPQEKPLNVWMCSLSDATSSTGGSQEGTLQEGDTTSASPVLGEIATCHWDNQVSPSYHSYQPHTATGTNPNVRPNTQNWSGDEHNTGCFTRPCVQQLAPVAGRYEMDDVYSLTDASSTDDDV